MYDNLTFILLVALFIFIIFVYFPNQNDTTIKVKKDETIIKVERNNEYAAVITKDNDYQETVNQNEIILTPVPTEEETFEISNIKVIDMNQEVKNTFIFNEKILINLDYKFPKGFYTFKLKTIPEYPITLKDDILRTKKGNTIETPLVFSVNNTENLEDVLIEQINIKVFATDDYEHPVFNYIHPINLTIKNLKINIVREEDFTTPLLLSNA